MYDPYERTVSCSPEFYRQLMEKLLPEERWDELGLVLFVVDMSDGSSRKLVFRRTQ